MEDFMGSYLNVGLMQSSGKNMDFESCLDKIEKDVNNLMSGMNRPEIIFGVEMGIGRFFKYDNCELSGDTIPGRVTDRLSETAKKYSIYLQTVTTTRRKEIEMLINIVFSFKTST